MTVGGEVAEEMGGLVSGLKPYPSMTASGVSWLGDIPASWEVRRNGRLFSQRKETGFPDLPILEVSLRTGVRVRDFGASSRKQVMSDRTQYKRAAAGDIAYNMMRLWQGAVGVAPVDGLISPAYVVARPFSGTLPRYFAYLFRTRAYMNQVDNYSRGIVKDRNRLYWEQFKQIPTPYPPPPEQAAIVRFLDHADHRIRRYIRAKQEADPTAGGAEAGHHPSRRHPRPRSRCSAEGIRRGVVWEGAAALGDLAQQEAFYAYQRAGSARRCSAICYTGIRGDTTK